MKSTRRAFVEQIISDKLQNTGPCFLDNLVTSLPALTWGEVFGAVDEMSRDGRVWLRQVGFSTYAVIPLPQRSTPNVQVPSAMHVQSIRSPDQPV